MLAIRGAITAENTKEDILAKTTLLFTEIIEKNALVEDEVISITFSATKDLTEVYPAVAIREMGWTDTALFCVQEMDVCGALSCVIRVLVLAEKKDLDKKNVKHIYLGGAKKLRPDLVDEMKNITVAIDGPAGSGKSTIAKEVAKRLKLTHIDSGSMYRAVALYMLENGVNLEDEQAVSSKMSDITLEFKDVKAKKALFLNGENVADKIRTAEVSKAASFVSSYKLVREELVAMQQEMGKNEAVIMDGRDIGTVVFKDADLKIYLVCSVEERARRRFKEFAKNNEKITLDEVIEELKERDRRDMTRENSPLKKADDAIEIDTTNMSIAEVVAEIENLAR